MMTVIDKRGIPLTHTFDELVIGECFQDTNDKLCMKIGFDRKMVYNEEGCVWQPSVCLERDQLIIPLKTTITIEREDSRK